MLFVYIKYFLREGIKNILVNGFMSATSAIVLICCLMITGVSVIITENIKFMLKNIEGHNNLTVYLKSQDLTCKPDEIKAKISNINNISTCEFYPKYEAIKEYESLLGDKVINYFQGEGNPLPDAFHVTLADLSDYNTTLEKLKSIPDIESISDRSEVAKKLVDLQQFVKILSFWIVISLAIVSIIIISNTIRITLYNRRFEINIMKSIGATHTFIKMPFIIEGIGIGVFAALVSISALNLAYVQIMKIINNIAPFKGIPFYDFYPKLFLIFTISGICFGLLGGVISIQRYINKEAGDVVAW
ncbi:MAG: FtsX-like permease family protein [Candidatus Improbicoccus devescovinae]|nr:MAG: FtsX-like permease family protein [Candidatus Improbicoccus devescovinae]